MLFDEVLDTTEGWAKENRHYWRRDWRGYVEFFMSQITTEPHSTKPYDDLVEWGMQTDAQTMLCDADAPQQVADEPEAVRLCRSLTCRCSSSAVTRTRSSRRSGRGGSPS